MNFDVLLSGLVGALLGSSMTLLLEFKKDRDEKNALRLLLKLEIFNHVQDIKTIYECIKNESKGDTSEFITAIKLKEIKPIEIKNDLWLNKSTLFAKSLNENEINDIEEFYKLLKNCEDYHLEIKNLAQKEKENIEKNKYNTNRFKDFIKSHPFLVNSPEILEKFKKESSLTVKFGEKLINKLK